MVAVFWFADEQLIISTPPTVAIRLPVEKRILTSIGLLVLFEYGVPEVLIEVTSVQACPHPKDTLLTNAVVAIFVVLSDVACVVPVTPLLMVLVTVPADVAVVADVAEVADVFAVSRPTVYNWFNGTTKPSRRMREKIQKLIDRLNAKHTENE